MRRLPFSVLLFALMCLIWGATWIAVKIGVAVVPPLLFAGTRFLVAGALLLGVCHLLGSAARIARPDWGRVLLVALLMVPLTYALLFWGAQHVSTGLAAVIDLSVLPVALLAFGSLAGQEVLDTRRVAALMLGAAGLVLLFSPHSQWGALPGKPGPPARSFCPLSSMPEAPCSRGRCSPATPRSSSQPGRFSLVEGC